MEQDYKKLYDSQLMLQGQVKIQGKSGSWHNARPELYYGLFYRIRDAWNVLWLKADALYWTIDLDK